MPLRHRKLLLPQVELAAIEVGRCSCPLCNDYEQHVTWAAYCKMMQALELGIPTQQSELGLPQADDIRIDDMGPVVRTAGNGSSWSR